MLSRTLLRTARRAAITPRVTSGVATRGIAGHDTPKVPNVSKTNETATRDPSMGADISETLQEGEKARSLQAPNRKETWSKSQQKREIAMSGPRFEHTIFELQVCDSTVRNEKEGQLVESEEKEDVESHRLFSTEDGDGMEVDEANKARHSRQEVAGDERNTHNL